MSTRVDSGIWTRIFIEPHCLNVAPGVSRNRSTLTVCRFKLDGQHPSHLLSGGSAARVERHRGTASRSAFGWLARVPIPVWRYIAETRMAVGTPSSALGTRRHKRKIAPGLHLGKFCHCETVPERSRPSVNHGRRL